MTKAIAFRPRDDEQEKALDKYMNENGLSQSEAIIKIIDVALNMENRYEPLDDACPALTFIDDHYECTWGRLANTPNTKNLGKTDEAKDNRCRACKKTLEMTGKLDELEALKEQTKKGIVVTIPSCSNYGSRVNENMERIWCPKIGKERPTKIEYRKKNDYVPCNREDKDKPCRHLRLTETTIKGKLPKMDGQNL